MPIMVWRADPVEQPQPLHQRIARLSSPLLIQDEPRAFRHRPYLEGAAPPRAAPMTGGARPRRRQYGIDPVEGAPGSDLLAHRCEEDFAFTRLKIINAGGALRLVGYGVQAHSAQRTLAWAR